MLCCVIHLFTTNSSAALRTHCVYALLCHTPFHYKVIRSNRDSLCVCVLWHLIPLSLQSDLQQWQLTVWCPAHDHLHCHKPWFQGSADASPCCHHCGPCIAKFSVCHHTEGLKPQLSISKAKFSVCHHTEGLKPQLSISKYSAVPFSFYLFQFTNIETMFKWFNLKQYKDLL